jgi:hypothetical protein
MAIAAIHAAVLLGLALGATAVGCGGGGLPPAEQEAAAQQAMESGDYQTALELYQDLMTRQGETGILEDMRFRAALGSAKCRAYLGQNYDVVDVFMGFEKDYPDEMETKGDCHALAIMEILFEKEAPVLTIVKLLQHAAGKYPDKKHRFEEFSLKLRERVIDSEEHQELKKIGGYG